MTANHGNGNFIHESTSQSHSGTSLYLYGYVYGYMCLKMTCNILLRGVGSVASAVRSISTFISNLAQGVFIQTTHSCGSVYYKMKMEMKHQQMSQKQSSNIESQSQSKPRSETTSGMKRLQIKLPKKQTRMEMKMKMICKQEERLLRKQDFLNSKHGTHYGYSASASSSVSSSAIEIHPIDTWRAREFPSLMEPICTNVMIRPHMSTNSSQNKEECDARTNAETQTQTQTELELVELEREREIYLDYAGAAIPSLSLLNALHAQSKEYQIMANPHSNGPAAARTKVAIEEVKSELLQFFGATAGCKFGFSDEEDADNKNDDEEYHPGYDIVFTSGATQGLQIVAECFDWSDGRNNCGRHQHQHQHQHQHRDDKDDDYQDHPDHPDRMGNKSGTMKANEHGSVLLYAENSHTSVLGMREPALAKGASFQCRNLEEISQAKPQDFASWACEERGTTSNTSLDEEETNAFVDYDRYGRNNGKAQRNMIHHQVSCVRGAPKNLLVFPLECNFDGSISSAQKIIQTSRASKSNWFSMLDIAKAAATSEINLWRR